MRGLKRGFIRRTIRSSAILNLFWIVSLFTVVPEVRASFLSTSIQNFDYPDAAAQDALRTCYQTGTCTASPASTIDIYPLPCDGSGGKACAGCYAWGAGGYTRVGALSKPLTAGGNPCANHLGTDLAIYAGYQIQCPNSSSSCTNGRLLLTCSYQEIDSKTNAAVSLRECNGGNPILVDPTNSPTVVQPTTSCPKNQQPDGNGTCMACPAGTYSTAGSSCQKCAYNMGLASTSPTGSQSDGSILLTINPTTAYPPYQISAAGGAITPTSWSLAGSQYTKNYANLTAAATTGTAYQFGVTDNLGCTLTASMTLMRSTAGSGCPAGQGSAIGDGTDCAPCASGTYKANAGNFACTACPYASITNGMKLVYSSPVGATAVTSCQVGYECSSGTPQSNPASYTASGYTGASCSTTGCTLASTTSSKTNPNPAGTSTGSFGLTISGYSPPTTVTLMNPPSGYTDPTSYTIPGPISGEVTFKNLPASVSHDVRIQDSKCEIVTSVALYNPAVACPKVTCAAGTVRIFRNSESLMAYEDYCRGGTCTLVAGSGTNCRSAKSFDYYSICSTGDDPSLSRSTGPVPEPNLDSCSDSTLGTAFNYWVLRTQTCSF